MPFFKTHVITCIKIKYFETTRSADLLNQSNSQLLLQTSFDQWTSLGTRCQDQMSLQITSGICQKILTKTVVRSFYPIRVDSIFFHVWSVLQIFLKITSHVSKACSVKPNLQEFYLP